MAVNAGDSGCVFHFECKHGPQRHLSSDTLNAAINRRKEWLDLQEHEKFKTFRIVAKKSFDYLPDVVENVEELPDGDHDGRPEKVRRTTSRVSYSLIHGQNLR